MIIDNFTYNNEKNISLYENTFINKTCYCIVVYHYNSGENKLMYGIFKSEQNLNDVLNEEKFHIIDIFCIKKINPDLYKSNYKLFISDWRKAIIKYTMV